MIKVFDRSKLHNETVILEPKAMDIAIIRVDNNHIVYSWEKLMEYFMETNNSWGEDEARDWIDFNIEGLTFLDKGPIIEYPNYEDV